MPELETAPVVRSLTRAELLDELAELLEAERWRSDFIEDRMPFVVGQIPEETVNRGDYGKPNRPTRKLIERRDQAFRGAEYAGDYSRAYDILIDRVDVILSSSLGDWEQSALSSAYSQAEEYAIVRGLPVDRLEGGPLLSGRKELVRVREFIQGYEDPRETLVVLEAFVTTMESGIERDETVREIRRIRQWWHFSGRECWGVAGPKPPLWPLLPEVEALIQAQREAESPRYPRKTVNASQVSLF